MVFYAAAPFGALRLELYPLLYDLNLLKSFMQLRPSGHCDFERSPSTEETQQMSFMQLRPSGHCDLAF